MVGDPGILAAVLLHAVAHPLLLLRTEHLQQAQVCEMMASRILLKSSVNGAEVKEQMLPVCIICQYVLSHGLAMLVRNLCTI